MMAGGGRAWRLAGRVIGVRLREKTGGITLNTHQTKRGYVQIPSRFILPPRLWQELRDWAPLLPDAICHNSLPQMPPWVIFILSVFSCLKCSLLVTYLVVQWLRFCTPSERDSGSIPDRELDTTCCNRQLKRTHICNEDQRPCMLQLRPGANKKINIKKKIFFLFWYLWKASTTWTLFKN